MKRRNLGWLAWCVVIAMLLTMAAPVALAAEGDEAAQEESYEVTVTAIADDKTGLYIFEDGQQLSVGVKAELTSTTGAAIDGTAELELYRRDDPTPLPSKEPKEVAVAAGETGSVYLTTTPLTDADYYHGYVIVKSKSGTVIGKEKFGFGLIRAPREGMIEDSIFGIGLSDTTRDRDTAREICKRIGVKWRRGVDGLNCDIVKPSRDADYWGEEQINNVVKGIKYWEDAGIMSLGNINYNLSWNVEPIPWRDTYGTHENRPADMDVHADMVYQTVLGLKDYVKAWETWNEPWIYGWTWATGSAQDYRDYCEKIYTRVRANSELDDIAIIGGGSTAFSRDVMFPWDADKNDYTTCYVDGSTNHAYGAPEAFLVGAVRAQQYLDVEADASAGSGGLWQTEFGTMEESFADVPEELRGYEVAKSLAPLHLLMLWGAGDMEIHCFWFSMCYDNGYSGEEFAMYDYTRKMPKPVVVAYSAASQFIENKKIVEDLYPDSKGIFGFMMEDKDTKEATAAVWVDSPHSGKLTLSGVEGVKFYDYLGTMVGDGTADSVEFDLGSWETLYAVSDKSASELSAIFKAGTFNTSEPVQLYPKMFTQPLEYTNAVEVEVENISGGVLDGTLTCTSMPSGFAMKENSLRVEDLQPGETRTVSLPLSASAKDDRNRYVFKFNMVLDNGITFEAESSLQVAYAPKKTVTVDGDLSDWSDVPKVTMFNNGGIDYLAAVLDPSKWDSIMSNKIDASLVSYEVQTAWDDENFYIAATVPDGTPAFGLPFEEDDKLFPFNYDSLMFAFNVDGFQNPDDFLYGEVGYEKYFASDTDYEFIIRKTVAGNGDTNSEMQRLLAPGTNIQGYYPLNPRLDPPLGTMDAWEAGGKEGKTIVRQDEASGLLVYEAAINWEQISEMKKQLDGLGANSSAEHAFAFAVNDSGEGARGKSVWQREAGKVISGLTGFAPRWSGGQKSNGGRIITAWGFGNLEANPIRINVNGSPILMDVAPVIQEGRTLVPLRAIFEALGADVEWTAETQTITGTKDGKTIVLQINNPSATVDGAAASLDVPPTIMNDRTLVPVRFISESLGAAVNWDEGARLVTVTQ